MITSDILRFCITISYVANSKEQTECGDFFSHIQSFCYAKLKVTAICSWCLFSVLKFARKNTKNLPYFLLQKWFLFRLGPLLTFSYLFFISVIVCIVLRFCLRLFFMFWLKQQIFNNITHMGAVTVLLSGYMVFWTVYSMHARYTW